MAKFCTGCGMEFADGLMFCTGCGTKAPENAPTVEGIMPMQEEKATAEPVVEVKIEEPASQVAQPQLNAPPPQNNQQCIPPQQNTQPVYQAQPQYNQQQQQYSPPPQQQTAYTPPPLPREILDSDVKGTKYEPISTWGFIGIMFLMCIPIIGQILVIVWACGGCRKLSKRTYARASLILMAIALVIGIILVIAAGSLVDFVSGKIKEGTNQSGAITDIFSSIMRDKDSEDVMELLENIEVNQ